MHAKTFRMNFNDKRRQQFLNEKSYRTAYKDLSDVIELLESAPAGSGRNEAEGWLVSYRMAAQHIFDKLTLRYTAGEAIDPLRQELEHVVARYERATQRLRKYERDPNASGFDIGSFDGYCPCLALISLCYLLHRRDLLPRIAEMLDGPDKTNAGMDFVIEEFLAYAPLDRYECDVLLATKPFGSLADAMSTDDNVAALKELQKFLKRWYKDLAAAPWHDTHKSSSQAGYYGYWSFEAGAAVLLLGIEDDSSLHSFLYYPKDLVAWAKGNIGLQDSGGTIAFAMRCEPGSQCPRAGYWMTPAQMHSRRYFGAGEIMPDIQSDYGAAIWQWDVDQSDPKL
ncbi:PoNe immunity protein domain-containing protein [Cupriavidus gilardii]|uniref:PoNe immunity protein domain-containing protein n=1 Tax=Cupriavidus gilardii TaxID=82541 RepID=UPI0020C65721|nr:PoNe immunity protein domain-containing protein [Cupriavidus gilardii]